MVNINCKLFRSNNCAFCKKIIANDGAWPELNKLKEINGHNITFEDVLLTTSTQHIFNKFNAKSYPRIYVEYNDKIYMAVRGNQKFDTCVELIKKAIDIVLLDDAKFKEAKDKQDIELDPGSDINMLKRFVQQPLIRSAYSEFVRSQSGRK